MAKKTTKKQQQPVQENVQKNPKEMLRRLLFIFMFSGNIAITVYLGILVSSPDTGQYILAGFSGVSAFYFLLNAIK